MCQAHYLRWRKHGDPLADVPIRTKIGLDGLCLVDGCANQRTARGYCGPHYNRWRRYGEPEAGGTFRKYTASDPCQVDGCTLNAKCRGWCTKHHARWVRHGDPTYEREITGHVHHSGYRYVSAPGHPNASKHGWLAEHRKVMSDHLGRPLVKGENVHHMNGDKLDNRFENLELWTTSQPKGQRVTDKLRWARELIALYEDTEALL